MRKQELPVVKVAEISKTPAKVSKPTDNRTELSTVSSRVRESLYELHAHVDFVFRDTISRASNISSISKKAKFELEKLTLSAEVDAKGGIANKAFRSQQLTSSLAPFTCDIDDEANSSSN